MLNNIKLKPEILFLIIGLFWGICFIFINPPIQAPDEDAHFIKMWGMLDGSYNFKVQNGEKGQFIPSSAAYIFNEANKMKFDLNCKTEIKEVFKLKNIPLNKENKTFYKQVPASYTVISYFPLILILLILKTINAPPATMFYILRFCSLLVYLAIMYHAIKLTPYKKWLFVILALLPVNLYIASAISTDCLAISVSFLLIAYTFYLKFDDKVTQISIKQIFIWILLFTLLCVLKYIYLPLILIYFLLPKEKFSNRKLYFSAFISILFVNIIYITVFLLNVINLSKIGIDLYDEHKIDKLDLLKHVLTHFGGFLKTVIITTIAKVYNMFSGAIAQFGWKETFLPIKTTLMFYVLIFLCLFYDKNDKYIKFKDKIIFLTASLVTYLLIMTSVFLIYTTYPIIHGWQGRYGSSFFIFIVLLFATNKIRMKNKFILLFTIVALQFLLFNSIQAIIQRYYI